MAHRNPGARQTALHAWYPADMPAGPATTDDDIDGPASDVHPVTRAEDPLLGKFLDARYRLDAVLGAGGVGVVYRAEHTKLRQPVAIKVLRDSFSESEAIRRRFDREAQALSSLRHPNVVALTDYGISDGIPYLVMELLDGRPLDDLIDGDGPPTPEVALEIFRGVLRGLAFAHERNILHRDLKPGNVFLQELPDDPHHVKLLDFGLAKMVADEDGGDAAHEPTLTRAGTILGTPAYMAPEQAAGTPVDARADVYSAGALLFELLAGRPPFVLDRRTDLLRAHMTEPVPDPVGFRPGLWLSEELMELLLKALAKGPGDRFASAKELLEAVDALPTPAATFDGREDPDATRDIKIAIPALEESARERSGKLVSGVRGEPRRRWGWPVAAVGVIVVGVVIGALAWPRDTTAETPDTPDHETGVTETGDNDTDTETGDTDTEIGDSETRDSETRDTETEDGETEDGETEDGDTGDTETGETEDGHTESAVDPMTLPMPPRLRYLRNAVYRSAHVNRSAHADLRRYQRSHPDDPRPSLILGHDLAQRGSWDRAVERYVVAYHWNRSARNHPTMLSDLIQAAAMEQSADDAAVAIVELYGRDALEEVAAAIEAEPQPPRRERLEALRDVLLESP